MKQYVVTNNGALLIAYSQDDFSIGKNVAVTYNTRFNGVCTFTGTVTAKRATEIDNPGTISITAT